MSIEDITLAAWIIAEKKRLDDFHAWWIAGQSRQSKEMPELSPDAMPEAEWDEQYRCWGGG